MALVVKMQGLTMCICNLRAVPACVSMCICIPEEISVGLGGWKWLLGSASGSLLSKGGLSSALPCSGSHIENWHSILRNGLVNASYTKLQVRLFSCSAIS